MKVITSYPVYIDKQKKSPNDYYLNNDGDAEKDYAKQGIAAAQNLLTGLINKPKREYTDAEQKCGKKPVFGKKKKAAWNKCVETANKPAKTSGGGANQNAPEQKSKTLLYVGIGVGVLALVGVVIYIARK
jgi:hypothetical protein